MGAHDAYTREMDEEEAIAAMEIEAAARRAQGATSAAAVPPNSHPGGSSTAGSNSGDAATQPGASRATAAAMVSHTEYCSVAGIAWALPVHAVAVGLMCISVSTWSGAEVAGGVRHRRCAGIVFCNQRAWDGPALVGGGGGALHRGH